MRVKTDAGSVTVDSAVEVKTSQIKESQIQTSDVQGSSSNPIPATGQKTKRERVRHVCHHELDCQFCAINASRVCRNTSKSSALAKDPLEDSVSSLIDSNKNPKISVMGARYQDRLAHRWRNIDPKLARKALLWTMCTLAAQAAIILWSIYRIHWYTRPLENQKFTGHSRDTERILAYVFADCVAPVLAAYWAFYGLEPLYLILVRFFDLNRKLCVRVSIVTLFALVATTIGMVPILLVNLGPSQAWYDQMRDTCRGFETRVEFDDSNNIPAELISLYRPGHRDQEVRYFEITTVTAPGIASTESFQSFYRVSRRTSSLTGGFVVDLDLKNNEWRLLNLTADTPISAIQASVVQVPLLIRNGTWSNSSLSSPHATFPELNIEVLNVHLFDKDCHFQPFVTVFQTEGMADAEVRSQRQEKWTPGGAKNVVLRTADFGHNMHGLEACIKSDLLNLADGGEAETAADVMVPLSLLAVLRSKMKDDGRYGGKCSLTS
ncbi:uncharacterized protein L3040_004804 [Drepanopeziza brunnea f. sp. 'multigermtubi']|uniref:Uncharacterized protein n=1 Tax=Marssonina brunnea f. sp. multigermtubi (strain MB_m1) TaxID=1072389 RepID=K1XM29_MARBU|nr:uncharacterized protein MBM_00691 [Drepanopeziza brunnea f. sp. 'multigermtubi' MB_m1]EKD21578.1 hypothetical protein MBM_00691 [Drepanopeziza brunnea f. sp. 'multigermtubi' MB_m1]KAJ5042250.1 hypothetical protein L3040_004804 [Drepanopeziza brunnea f. sp. 'multigermtubi']